MLDWIRKHKNFILLAVILLIGLFLRVYKLSAMVNFDFDQEYAAMFAYKVLVEYPIQTIGQGLSVQGLFMGPFYFYYLVPFFAITHLHPIGGYIGSVVLGLITIVAYFFILKEIFGPRAGLIAAFLRAILFHKIQNDWTMAPSYGSELAVLFTWYFFYKYWNGKTQYLPWLSFIFGLYTSFHPILFPLYAVFLILVALRRKFPTIKQLIFSIILFVIPISPLIRFEYYRHFLEVKMLFSLHASNTGETKTLHTLWNYILIVFHYPSFIFGIPLQGIWGTLLSLAFFGILIWLLVRGIGFWKETFHKVILIITAAVVIGYYLVLPVHAPEYYFYAIETLVFIYTAASLALFRKALFEKIVYIILAAIFFVNISAMYRQWTHPTFISLADKEYIFQQIKLRQANNPHYGIFYTADPGQQYGLGYLQRYYHLDMSGEALTTYEIVIPAYKVVGTPDIISPSKNVAVIIHRK
jgi:hypothetical protein